MDSTVRTVLVATALAASTFGVLARGGDHRRRELPANAVQLPDEDSEDNVSHAQKAMLLRDTIRATIHQAVHHPIKSTATAAGRLAERIGVRLSRSVPGLSAPRNQEAEAGGPLTPARITPLFDSVPAHNTLIDLIAVATVRIDLMMFGWDDDVAGQSVADALIARARDGILVRLMVDRGGYVSGTGNAKVARGEPTFLDALRAEPNVRLIESPDACFRFDHRKVAVVDDRIVWSGGMILTEPALKRWHNFAFLAEGPVVRQYADLFNDRWEELGGCRVARVAPPPVSDSNAIVRMVRTDLDERTLKEAVYGAVDSARHHIYLENPYFSDTILVKKLVAARRRGVDVRAVVTLRGDVQVVNRYVAVTANHMFRGGVRVYLYPKMTHVKAMSVDGTLAYIGTGNFDELSLRNNREVALTVRGPELIREIDEKLFFRDMNVSQEIRALLPAPRGRWLLEAGALWY